MQICREIHGMNTAHPAGKTGLYLNSGATRAMLHALIDTARADSINCKCVFFQSLDWGKDYVA
jgi:hypothetical protein